MGVAESVITDVLLCSIWTEPAQSRYNVEFTTHDLKCTDGGCNWR